ncbi:MAG: zinc-ribbon domain-containing protein [Ruminococcaceae bacterium]|nr:zinc-ribbon domain-containing protein [Oscillospiraceae bacterium]
MICKNCGAEIKDNISFCPKCGTSQEVSAKKAEGKKVCTRKEYFEELAPEKAKKFRKKGIIFSVVFIVLSLLICAVLWIAVNELDSYSQVYSDNSELIGDFMDDPESLSERDERDLLRVLDMTRSEFAEFESKLRNEGLQSIDELTEYVNLDAVIIVAMSDAGVGNMANAAIAAVVSAVVFIITVCVICSILALLAVIFNIEGLAIAGLTVSALFVLPTFLATLPLMILSLIILGMMRKSRREYDKYIKSLK